MVKETDKAIQMEAADELFWKSLKRRTLMAGFQAPGSLSTSIGCIIILDNAIFSCF